MAKIRRNDVCPCGSGIKYKKCCIPKFIETNRHNVTLHVNRIHFTSSKQKSPQVLLKCFFIEKGKKYDFSIPVFFNELESNWSVFSENLLWKQEPLLYLISRENVNEILSSVIKLFKPLHVSPINFDIEKGFGLRIGHSKMTNEQSESAFSVVRPEIVSRYKPDWSFFWDSIIQRAKFDPELKVQGFSRSEIISALQNLRPLFPSEWVRKNVLVSQNLPKQTKRIYYNILRSSYSWFPIYHLIGLSLGSLCKDPGLNALVSLGNSITLLRALKNGNKILKNILKPGMIHQANLAAHFARRNILQDVEIPSGSGTNDIRIFTNGKVVDIEMKTIISDNVEKVVKKEIRDKATKTSKNTKHPIIMYFGLLEKPISCESEVALKNYKIVPIEEKVKSITMQCFGTSDRISGLVVGTMGIDTHLGGYVKWKVEKVLVNPFSKNQMTEAEIREIFLVENQKPQGPVFPLNSLLEFSVTT